MTTTTTKWVVTLFQFDITTSFYSTLIVLNHAIYQWSVLSRLFSNCGFDTWLLFPYSLRWAKTRSTLGKGASRARLPPQTAMESLGHIRHCSFVPKPNEIPAISINHHTTSKMSFLCCIFLRFFFFFCPQAEMAIPPTEDIHIQRAETSRLSGSQRIEYNLHTAHATFSVKAVSKVWIKQGYQTTLFTGKGGGRTYFPTHI